MAKSNYILETIKVTSGRLCFITFNGKRWAAALGIPTSEKRAEGEDDDQ